MDRRRAVAALLALAACIACSAAAPTATNQTALELSDGPSEGCYYNFQHYGEGDRIMTNEPCLNCTCHNRMLMCYLRVCPFTKPIGQDCTVEKRADQCCPIVTCPDVPVDLLTSTSTSSPAEYGTTGVGKHDRYGCSINGKYFSEGSKVPPTPNKPCEHCYCIRNMTTCVMQECTLHVDGCTPIYHKDVCCPVRYSCDHPEDEIPLLDDMTTTVRPTPGFLLTTTTVSPVTQLTQDCVHDDEIFPDGAHIKTDKACEHCYCMKGDIVCVVQGCGTPMENEGKNCTALPLRAGQCCPDTYICEGDDHAGDLTTEIILQTTIPPRRVAVEGSGYRNEPGEPFTEMNPFEIDEEGSGDEYTTSVSIDTVVDVAPEKEASETDDDILKHTTEKGMHIGLNTEPDKEQNTIPDISSNEESSTLPVEDMVSYTTQQNKELVATTTEFIKTIPDKQETIEDDVHKKDELITTESVFRKEDSDIISDEVLLHKEHDELTTTFLDLIDATPNKKENEVDINTGTDLPSEHDNKATTEAVKYTSGYLDTVSQKETTTERQSESTTTEISKLDGEYPSGTPSETNIYSTSTKAVTDNIDLPETTPINIDINEVSDNISTLSPPGRIPGEGDCLLNGITYTNNTTVPRTNNCHTSCKCVSSIIKCDPIVCIPPPEYMENMNDCQPVYDSPDSCCPTYICSPKETIPPQSHNQMSGTESPKPIAVSDCTDNNCGSEKEQKPELEPSIICTSDDCSSEPVEKPIMQSQDCILGNCDNLPQIPVDTSEGCSGVECQEEPVIACDDENCKTKPAQVVDTSPICEGKDGCKIPIDAVQDGCTDEICKSKEITKIETSIPEDTAQVTTETVVEENIQTTKESVGDSDETKHSDIETNIPEKTTTLSDTETETNKLDSDNTAIQTELPVTVTETKITDEDIDSSKKDIETETTLSPAIVSEDTKHPLDDHETISKEPSKSEETKTEMITEGTYTEKLTTDKTTDKELSSTVTTELINTKSEEMFTEAHELTSSEKVTESTTNDFIHTTVQHETATDKRRPDETEHITDESILIKPELSVTEMVKEEETYRATTSPLPQTDSDKDTYEHITQQSPQSELDNNEQTTPQISVVDNNTDKYEEAYSTSKLPEIEIVKQEDVYFQTDATPKITQTDIDLDKTKLEESQPENPDVIEEEYSTSELPGLQTDLEKDNAGETHTTSSPKLEITTVKDIFEESHVSSELPGTEIIENIFKESISTSVSPALDKDFDSNINKESFTTLRLPTIEKEKDTYGETEISSELPTAEIDKEKDMYEESQPTSELTELEKDTTTNEELFTTTELPELEIEKDDMYGESHTSTSKLPEADKTKEADAFEESHASSISPGIEIEQDKDKDTYEEIHFISTPKIEITTPKDIYEVSHASSETPQTQTDTNIPIESYTTSTSPESDKNIHGEAHTVQVLPIEGIEISTVEPEPTILVDVETDKIQKATDIPKIYESHSTADEQVNTEPIDISELPKDHTINDEMVSITDVLTESFKTTTVPSQKLQPSIYEITTQTGETITEKHESETITEKHEGYNELSTIKPEDGDHLILEKETKIPTTDKIYPSTVPTITEVTNPAVTESDHLATDLIKSDEFNDTKVTEYPVTISHDVSSAVTEKELTAETEDDTVLNQDINTEAPDIHSTLLDVNKDKIKEESFTELPYSPTTYIAPKETIIPNDKIIETHDIETDNPLQSEKEPDLLDDKLLHSTLAPDITTVKTSEQYTQKQEATITEVTPKYTLADDTETKQPVNTEVEKDLESHELTTPVPNTDITSVVDKEPEVPITDTEKSQERFTIAPENKVSTEQDTTITTTQRLTSNDLFITTTPNKVTNENEYTTQHYASEPFDLNTVTFKDTSLATVIDDKEDHKPEKPKDDTDKNNADQTTTYPILEHTLTEANEQNKDEHITAKPNLDFEKETDLSIPITDSSINTGEPQFVTQSSKISDEQYLPKITENPSSTQKSIQEETVTEEIKLTTILETEITKGEMKHEVSIETSPEQPESHTKLHQTTTTTESMLISADKDSLPDIDHPLMPEDKIHENKTVLHLQTTLSTLLAEEDKEIIDSMVTSKDSLNIETEAESSTKMSSDQTFDEELKQVTEIHELVTEIPHDTTQPEHKITADTVITSEKPESPLHLTTLLPSNEVTNVEQNDILISTVPQSGYEITEVTSEKVIPTDVEEVLPISEEETPHTDSVLPIENITTRPSDQVPLKEEAFTEIIQADSTTHPPKIIETGQDDELIITDSMLDKQEDNRVTSPTTEKVPEIGSDKLTTESYKQELSSASTQTSTYPTKENVSIEDTKQEHKITTTETFISSEVTTLSSKMEDFTTEKQEMLPIHVLDTTENQYESVTELKESDIITTEQPDKNIPEKAIDDNIQETSDKTQSPHEEILHEKVPQHPDIIGEKEFTSSVPESDELPLMTTASLDKNEDQLTIYTTQIPLQTEKEITNKELHIERTTEDMAHVLDLESNPDIPITTQKHEELDKHKYTTDLEYTFSETTPFSIELEEHTHAVVDESSSIVPITEDSSIIHQEPERGDITPDQLDSSEHDQEKLYTDITTQKEKIGEPVTHHITTIKDVTKSEETTEQILPSFTSIDLDEPKKETTHGAELIITSPKTINEEELFTTEHDKLQHISVTTHDLETSTEKDSLQPLEPAPSAHTTIPEEQLIQEVQKATTVKFEEENYTYSPTPVDKLPKPEDKPSDMNIPELPKPITNEEPVENIPSPDFPPSGSAGYGQEPDYVEEDQAFGPGTCRYGGKVYVSAQQIPRDDPCDFCFCFRSDIICLQQSCPPPIHGCHEEPIQGFCCPRYECPVSMATTLNMTTTTTTTTTTLPPHFLPHAYKGAAQRRGCQIKGHTYKVGEVVRASSGPCLHCTCGGDGQMKCDPKACTPEPMLRQMIAAAVSAKRRR